MALTNQPRAALIGRPFGAQSSQQLEGAEKASSTWKKGAFLIDDDSGYLTESTSPIDGSAVGKRTLGLAEADATGTTGADVRFSPLFGQNLLVEITLSDATAGTHTLAQADQWKVYPITKATENWYLDANAVSDTGGGLVVAFKDALGTVDGRVYALVTQEALGGANAGSSDI